MPVTQANAELPAEFGRILNKALEKDRNLRYQTATDLKTDLIRLRRDTDPSRKTTAEATGPDTSTEDIITVLSKIKGLNIFSRATVLAYRDRPVTPAQISQQLRATCVLTGSLRRAGNRLRINAQLVDTRTDFPLWSERYDREMQDAFVVQDEIALKIAEALRLTLAPQGQLAPAAKPTENLPAHDL